MSSYIAKKYLRDYQYQLWVYKCIEIKDTTTHSKTLKLIKSKMQIIKNIGGKKLFWQPQQKRKSILKNQNAQYVTILFSKLSESHLTKSD